MNPGNEEIVIWDAFAAGDKASFERLYHIYYPALEAYATKLLNDPVPVQETIQDLFVKLWRNKAGLQRPGSIKHYLLKALRNTIYNKLKSVQRVKSMGALEDFEAFYLVYNEQIPVNIWGDLPQSIQSRINQLTPRQKEIVYLYFVEDLSYAQIAELLNMTRKSTYKLLYRALENLKAEQIIIK